MSEIGKGTCVLIAIFVLFYILTSVAFGHPA